MIDFLKGLRMLMCATIGHKVRNHYRGTESRVDVRGVCDRCGRILYQETKDIQWIKYPENL